MLGSPRNPSSEQSKGRYHGGIEATSGGPLSKAWPAASPGPLSGSRHPCWPGFPAELYFSKPRPSLVMSAFILARAVAVPFWKE